MNQPNELRESARLAHAAGLTHFEMGRLAALTVFVIYIGRLVEGGLCIEGLPQSPRLACTHRSVPPPTPVPSLSTTSTDTQAAFTSFSVQFRVRNS